MRYPSAPTQKARARSTLRLLAVLFVLVPAAAAAQPVIGNASGQMVPGATVTITGTNFGAGGQLLSWDDFERGSNGTTIHNVAPVVGPNWTNMIPTNPARYSNERSNSGSMSAKISWETYSICAFGTTNIGAQRSIYMTFWRYHDPSNPTLAPTYNHKTAYFYGPANELNQWLPFMIPAGTQGWASQLQNQPGRIYYWNGPTYAQTTYNWGRWETFINYDTSLATNDGYVEDWYNCVRYVSSANQDLSNTEGGNGVEDIRIGHMFQGYENMDYVRSYIDDVYISTSRARVELGNASTFTACTLREILVPQSWGSSVITATMRYNRFTPGSQAWLFVVDANGTPSAGRQVTLGGSADTTPPSLGITAPVAPGGTYDAPALTVDVSGTASDNVGIGSIRWANSLGGSGVAQGTTTWLVDNLPLQPGTNVVTVTAADNAGNETQRQITVLYQAPGMPGQPIRN